MNWRLRYWLDKLRTPGAFWPAVNRAARVTIVDVLDSLFPGACRTQLVMWGLLDDEWPGLRGARVCRERDVVRYGGPGEVQYSRCYCGKVCTRHAPETEAEAAP